MEKEKLEGLLIDYIDGSLDERDSKFVESVLSNDEAARQLYGQLKEVMTAMTQSPTVEPAAALQRKFDALLREEIREAEKTSSRGRQVFFSPVFVRVAAAVLMVMVSGAIAYWTIKSQQQRDELASLRKEMEVTRSIMMSMLDNQQSASARMRGTTVAYNMEKPDDQIVSVLVRTMNTDPNTNVRLAAMEALEKFNLQPLVRKALIASLTTQKDPIVQIALIQLMVRMKEKTVVKELENITNDVQTMKAVKDEAYTGILKLS